MFLSFVLVVPGSTAAAPSHPADTGRSVCGRFHVNTLRIHTELAFASINAAAETIKATVWKAYLRIAPDPTPPAGP